MYIIIEIQTPQTGTPAVIVNTRESWAEAKSTYHAILSAAALSSVYCHAAVLMDIHGNVDASEYYTHPGAPESGDENG